MCAGPALGCDPEAWLIAGQAGGRTGTTIVVDPAFIPSRRARRENIRTDRVNCRA
jgi:hypothetical protein